MDKNNNKNRDDVVDEKRQKQLDYYKAYYQKNKETKLKQSKENYYKTIDQQHIRSHKYFEEHKDEIKKKHANKACFFFVANETILFPHTYLNSF